MIKKYIMRTARLFCGVIVDVLFMQTAFSGIIGDDHI